MIGTSKSIWGFDPRSIPNCIVWLDGGDSNTMTPSTPSGGTQITAWLDKSVNGVSYASGAVPTYPGCNIAPPTYVTGGGLNFNPSIPGGSTFTNNVTQGLSAVGGFPLNATGFTAFAVAVATGTMTSFNSYFSYFTGGAEFIDFNAAGGTFGQIITDTTGLNVTIPSTILTTTRQIQSVRSSTTGTNFFVNGSLSNSSVFNYTQVNNPVATVVWIGNQAPGFRSFSGTIFELLVYNQSLSSNQRQTVEGYLARKWAITLATTHPFFVLPPFNRYFNPNDIPGCSLWLDAADNSTMNSTTTVTSWSDKSGLNNTMTGTATWTGSNMSFNGSTQAFSNTGYVFPVSAYSMFGVYSNTTAPTAAAYMNAVYGSNGFPMLGTFGTAKDVSARSVVANTGALSVPVPVGWAARITSAGNDVGYGIAADSSGNVFVTGNYGAALTLFNSSGVSNASLAYTGSNDCFIAKYSSAGAVLWAARIAGTTTSDDDGRGVATDTSGNVFVTGSHTAALTLFNSSGVSNAALPSTGFVDCFVAKYSSAGAVLWAARIGGLSNDYGYGVATDTSGNVFVTGFHQGQITVYNQGFSGTAGVVLPFVGGVDGFIAKYSSAGAVLWAARIAGTTTSDDRGMGIATDTSGNAVFTGWYGGTLTIYNQGFSGTVGTTLSNEGGRGAFVAKYSSDGAVLWAARIGSVADDYGYGIATDTSGNVLVTGTYFSALTIYNQGSSGTAGATLPGTSQGCFVAKYSPAGAVLWAARTGSTGSSSGSAIATDTSGNVLVAGLYGGGAAVTVFNQGFSGSAAVTLTFPSSNDGFIAKYSSAGAVLWATRIAGSGDDRVNAIATDASGNVLVTGQYNTGTLTLFGANGASNASLALTGINDCFIAKYNPDGYITNVPTPASSNVLVSATYAPSTFSPFVNGCNATTLAGTTLATTGIFVGGPSNYFNGTISELLIYSANLSAAQRQQVEGYLIDKWSLRSQTVSNHQYRLIPPATSQPAQFAEVTPGNWTRDWQPELRSLIAANNPTNATVIPTISYGTGGPALSPALSTQNYFGCVLAPNGNIYCIPAGASNILIINPTTNAVSYGTNSLSPALSTQTYLGGVLAPNGNIYCVPGGASNVLIINPTTNAVSYLNTPLTPALSTQTYTAPVLAPNGNIYCMPFASSNILIINPTTNTVSYGTGGPALTPALSTQRYYGGVLAPNGNIYGTNFAVGTSNILIINPTTNTVSYGTGGPALTPPLSTPQTYMGGVLAPNGNIYGAPNFCSNILIINPTTNTVSYGTGGPALTPALSTQRYRSGVLAPNGNIYYVPYFSSNVLIINPTTNTVSYGTNSLNPALSAQSYAGGVLAPNGNIYCAPQASSNILIISNTYSLLPSSNYCLSAYANKY